MVLAALATVLAACGSSPTLRRSSEICSEPRLLPAGTSSHSFTSFGSEHRYELYVPPGYDGRRRLPVMMTFHGLGGDPATFLATTRMKKLAAQQNFIVVTPRGTGEPSRWDFRGTRADSRTDAEIVHDLVSEVRRAGCTDPSRFYASGFSNGAVLALTLACDPRHEFAAVGAVSGAWYPRRQCAAAGPTRVVYIHGTADRIAPFRGGSTLIGVLPPVRQMLADWASHDACTASATDRLTANVQRTEWSGCEVGGALTTYVIRGGGHAWPGGDASVRATDQRFLRARGHMSQELDATKVIWDFVSRTSRYTADVSRQ